MSLFSTHLTACSSALTLFDVLLAWYAGAEDKDLQTSSGSGKHSSKPADAGAEMSLYTSGDAGGVTPAEKSGGNTHSVEQPHGTDTAKRPALTQHQGQPAVLVL